jgi:hypothetical protein
MLLAFHLSMMEIFLNLVYLLTMTGALGTKRMMVKRAKRMMVKRAKRMMVNRANRMMVKRANRMIKREN